MSPVVFVPIFEILKSFYFFADVDRMSSDGGLPALLNGDIVDVAAVQRRAWLGLSCWPLHRRLAWELVLGVASPLAASRSLQSRRLVGEYCAQLAKWREAATVDDLTASPVGRKSDGTSPNSSGRGSLGVDGAVVGIVQTTSGNSSVPSLSFDSSTDVFVANEELAIIKQIRKDVPRSTGGMAALAHSRSQTLLERVLFVWALRHPACGYVQGMNDLAVPFVCVVIADELRMPPEDLFSTKCHGDALVSTIPADAWEARIEPAVYWMTSRFIERLQDNFTGNQRGAHRMVADLEAIVKAADPSLWKSIVTVSDVPFALFSFRWINCLLQRELSFAPALRLMDTYVADEIPVGSFHPYVCAAFLLRFRPLVLAHARDLGTLLPVLQNLPTQSWAVRDVDELVASAFVLSHRHPIN